LSQKIVLKKQQKSIYMHISKNVVAAVLILLFIVSYLAYDNFSLPSTGHVTSQNIQESYKPQAQQPVAKSAVQQNLCNDLAKSKPSNEQAAFLESCAKYAYKFCFSASDCGPFPCVGNKCQVQ
jgi:cytochrome c-type biogenesis protein CcmH/NrfG